MTQTDLAVKLNVTDKAVSRWERGIGFPDINTLEPLASALEISVLELMKSERIIMNEIVKEEASDIISDALSVAKLQRKRERKNALSILLVTLGIVIFTLFLDSNHWKIDTFIFASVGIIIPLFCICGFLVLSVYGIWRKVTAKPFGQTFVMAFVLLLFFVAIFGLFALAGVLGIGPVPN